MSEVPSLACFPSSPRDATRAPRHGRFASMRARLWSSGAREMKWISGAPLWGWGHPALRRHVVRVVLFDLHLVVAALVPLRLHHLRLDEVRRVVGLRDEVGQLLAPRVGPVLLKLLTDLPLRRSQREVVPLERCVSACARASERARSVCFWFRFLNGSVSVPVATGCSS